MASVFVVSKDGSSTPMQSILCKHEDKELQTILEKNPNLLPGDQIDTDAPCRWLLVKREMPVPSPVSGGDQWSIDFLFVDQNAVPTFVECKRYLDTRSRREVVGQVLEYAANGQHYWSSADLQQYAQASASASGTTLEERLQALQTELADSPDAFFKEVEKKLKASEVRLVFFLEQAPVELKRLVEFINKQMSDVDVLLVEARQFESGGTRVVVPTLYGFTEQIREFKKAASAASDRKAVAVDWSSFATNAQQKGVDEVVLAAMQRVYDTCKALNADIAWGRGSVTASFGPKWPTLTSTGSPFSVYANGTLEMHFPAMQRTESARAVSAALSTGLRELGLTLPADFQTAWFSFQASDWVPKVEGLVAVLNDAIPRS